MQKNLKHYTLRLEGLIKTVLLLITTFISVKAPVYASITQNINSLLSSQPHMYWVLHFVVKGLFFGIYVFGMFTCFEKLKDRGYFWKNPRDSRTHYRDNSPDISIYLFLIPACLFISGILFDLFTFIYTWGGIQPPYLH